MNRRTNYINIENRKKQIIFAGRIDNTKGIDKLLYAWKKYCTFHNQTIKLIICGTGPEEQWCKDFIVSNNLESNAKMMGFIENKKVVQIISESMALILPTQWYEGFPMTIVEAFGYGTPVLGSNIGNVGNLVIDGVTGYKFEHSSSDSMVEAVNRLVEATEYELDLFRSTFEYFQRHFTAEMNIKILSSIYEQVMK
ncbi:glycosyltransferase [Neobacillus niacini]|uniref:glycosyltransferase n=1 Tax=Neobacillus niacini TaxID=86668 RepID=UPI001C8E63C8|nr:glycosyltransferase [Neobacillus niacini]MBY0145117.1 glycosyltransferase family 4 protein [Neobacillus niacini]